MNKILGLKKSNKSINTKKTFERSSIKNLFTSKKIAFTLSEVLITLGIIGVVAAMTLPTVIFNYKAKVTVSKVKKNFSILSQAVKLVIEENGDISGWGLVGDTTESAQIIGTKLKPYLKIIDDCGTERCASYTQEFYHIDKKSQQQGKIKDFGSDIFYKLKLSDGTEWMIRSGTNRFAVLFDVNGSKQPNSLGRDIFQILVATNGQPYVQGVGDDPNTKGWQYCNVNNGGEGWYCGAWVLYKENMDYLKCPEVLTWDGQSTCK